eukprot:6063229-Amphidinium_carterae.1
MRPSPVPAIAAGPGFMSACVAHAKAPCPSMVGAPPSQGGAAAYEHSLNEARRLLSLPGVGAGGDFREDSGPGLM